MSDLDSKDLDSKLRQLVHEMTDTAPPAGPVPMVAPVVELRQAPRARMVVRVAAAAVVVLLVGGVAVGGLGRRIGHNRRRW